MKGQSQKLRKRAPLPQWDNPLEAIKTLGSDIVQSANEDLVQGMAQDILGEFGLRPSRKFSGTLAPTETLNLAELEKAKTKKVEKPVPQIQRWETQEILYTKENQEIARKISQIQWELKQLISSSKQLEVEFNQVTVETVPAKPGVYHLNFFEWLLSLVKKIREKVEDSHVWMAAFQSKRSKRGYWSMFKKHGTSFGLSHERVIATQTG